ncbi:MAG: hypothetical protein PHC97_04625 [Patescibacteria group bacterium]|nr:hypothetical protein [Patescibacteria group bacterium]
MSDRTKRILLVAGFILAVVLIGLAIYFIFFQPLISPSAPITITPTPPINTNGLPVTPGVNVPPTNVNVPIVSGLNVNIPPLIPAIPGPTISNVASGGITSFSTLESDSTLSPTFAVNGKDVNYLDVNTGLFHTLKPDGTKVKLSDSNFANVSTVVWSPDSSRAIITYSDGSKILYNFNKKTFVTLPSQWQDFSFSKDGNNIAFKDLKIDPEDSWLAMANTDGSGYQQIERLGDKANDVYVQWSPNNSYVALYRAPLDADRSEVYPIGKNGENYNSFRIEGRDPRFVYSPNGNTLLYSAYNISSAYKPTLWIVNSDPANLGTGRNALAVDTWADKCTFTSETLVYCAVPNSLDIGAGFRPDLADSTPDQFYKIDLTTGSKQLIAQPLFPTTVDKLMVSPDGKSLIWTEKNTGKIKEMNL